MDESKFRPLRALILVRRDTPTTEKGGIIIPENVQTYGWRATVIRGGPDASEYKKGDNILFQKEFTVLPFKDRTLALTEAKHILARLVVEKDIETIRPCNRFVMVEPDSAIRKEGAIELSDKTNKPVKTGAIFRRGNDCTDMKCGSKVWFEAGFGVDCMENDVHYKLIDEDNIMAVEK